MLLWAHHTLMMAAMTGFQNLFGANDLGIRWMRNTGLNLTNRLPLIKEMIVDQGEHGEDLIMRDNVGCVKKI